MRLTSTTLAFVLIAVFGRPAAVAAQLPAETFDGRPTYKEGKALGYFVWRDGDTWKLRWMTFGANHKFNGRIVVEGGDIKSFKRIDVDEERKVIRPGVAPHVVRGPRGKIIGTRPGRAPVVAERDLDKIEQEDEHTVRWLTNTNDDVDGLDVKVTDGATGLRLMLMIDGQPRPNEVEVGKSNFKPGELPVRVKLR
ncbi:MAG TPA: hypothetical protein VGQ52_14610 [Gemmatimonadaceae bacterium]|nr:hypothetical protein [Gemmatimonadaceae bacterium]